MEPFPNQNPGDFEHPQKKEELWLTSTEVTALIEKLRTKNKAIEAEMSKHSHILGVKSQAEIMAEYDYASGFVVAKDKYDKELLKKLSDFYRIDFKTLQKIPVADADLLFGDTAWRDYFSKIHLDEIRNAETKKDREGGIIYFAE